MILYRLSDQVHYICNGAYIQFSCGVDNYAYKSLTNIYIPTILFYIM